MRASIFVFACLSLSATACVVEDIDQPEADDSSLRAAIRGGAPASASEAEAAKLWDPAASAVARMIASAMDDVELRRLLKDEATRRFDGDYDVMFDVVRDRVLPSNAQGAREPMKVAELLRSRDTTPEGLDQRFWDGLVEHFPLLQISIPALPGISAEDWDVERHLPLVAFIPADYREGRDELIPAYDARGGVHYLDPRTPPPELVVVVGQNERVIAQPKDRATSRKGTPGLIMCPEATASGSENVYFVMEDCGGTYGGGGGTPPPPGTTPTPACDRDLSSAKDYLWGMEFNSDNDLDYAEEWIKGAPEMRVVVTFANPQPANFGTLEKHFTDDRSRFKDCGLFSCSPEWYPLSLDIVTWDPAVYGDRMKYTWWEKDSGASTTFSVSLSSKIQGTTVTGSVSHTITDDDDHLGESIVEYCDNMDAGGTLYNTGHLKFSVGH